MKAIAAQPQQTNDIITIFYNNTKNSLTNNYNKFRCTISWLYDVVDDVDLRIDLPHLTFLELVDDGSDEEDLGSMSDEGLFDVICSESFIVNLPYKFPENSTKIHGESARKVDENWVKFR